MPHNFFGKVIQAHKPQMKPKSTTFDMNINKSVSKSYALINLTTVSTH